MKCILIACVFVACALPAVAQPFYKDIKNYGVYFGRAQNSLPGGIVLRKFESNGKGFVMIVDPETMATEIKSSNACKIVPMSLKELRTVFENSPYQRSLIKAENQSVAIQDAGIESGMPKEMGIVLTVDLCPSHRPLDRVIFNDIFQEFGKVEQPVPVALSITGLWMIHHQTDLKWLNSLEQRRKIHISWINHSFNHRVSKSLPLKQNFMLEAGTDINYEVLETEKAMLGNGLLPSVFFRFPGLVSDQQLVKSITAFGLIPVGTDAWLAKGQQPQAGSIVLIHGNGNEPIGVMDFINLLRSKADLVAKKQWLLYDLRESIDDEFKE